MQIFISKIDSRWRLTIPAPIRKMLQLKPGDKVNWQKIGSGICKITPVKQNALNRGMGALVIFPKAI
jgi:AbrB family looped-hinge helix DNA binding protein